jgi:cell pole-organizing protein PopZ
MAKQSQKEETEQPPSDQSMEEILQSIRRIIDEEDNSEEAFSKPYTGKEEILSAPAQEVEDVLELTEMLEDDGSVVNLTDTAPPRPKASQADAASAASAKNQADILKEIDSALQGKAPKPAPAKPVFEEEAKVTFESRVSESPSPAASMRDTVENLVSESSISASVAAMQGLIKKNNKEESKVTSLPFRSGETVEDIVVEALKPLLKEWLDENLPIIIERIVEREIQKIASRIS